MEYFVHAVARTQSTYDDIVVKLPIVIEPKVINQFNVIIRSDIEEKTAILS